MRIPAATISSTRDEHDDRDLAGHRRLDGTTVSGSSADSAGNDGADELLLAELRRAAARMDPVPPAVTASAHGLLDWRDPDGALAALVADSRELTGAVRSGDREVLLRFESEDFALSVEANPDGRGRYRLVGQVEPGGPGHLRVRQDGGPGAVVTCDEWGRFEAHPVAPGPVSLRWTPTDGPPVQTTWIVI